MPNSTRRHLVIVLLALSAAGASDAVAHASALTGGDPCALLEGLPDARDPLRTAGAVRRIFKSFERAGSDQRKLGKVHDALMSKLSGALDEATRVFHPKGVAPRKWGDKERARARAYLDKWAGGPRPILRVGDVGFEPVPGLRATLMYTACRSGRPDLAIAYGRRATNDDEGPARAFAALLQLESGNIEHARELLEGLAGDSFLVAWIQAEFAADAEAFRRTHATARRRTGTPAQAGAIDAQARRRAATDVPSTPAGPHESTP